MQAEYNHKGPYEKDAGVIGSDVRREVEMEVMFFEDGGKTQMPRSADGL